MSNGEYHIDWQRTHLDGSRREQILKASTMTVRQRLKVLDELTALSERIQIMVKHTRSDPIAVHKIEHTHEQRTNNADRKQR